MDLKLIQRGFRSLERAVRPAPPGERPSTPDLESKPATVRAQLASLELEVTETFQSMQRDARLGQLALELARLFAASSAPREFSRVALKAICEVMNASSAYVLALDEEAGEARVVARKVTDSDAEEESPRGLSRSFLNQLIQTRATLLVRDAQTSRDTSSIITSGIRSVLATPLLLDGGVGGAIYLENTTVASVFGESDKALIESIARLLAPYIQAGRRLETAIGERERLEAALEGESSYSDFIGRSPAARKLLVTIDKLKDSDAPVLVRGESGTGKELVARALHYSGRRAAGPLVTINCAAIPEGLMESELFGHERGAFTGATEMRKGKFEQAHGGTLFLDEVGDLRSGLQAKMLRVLQDQRFERVGGSRTIQVDVRLVAATNKDLRQLVTEGEFREDLYFRLDVVPIEAPPLRERIEDIPLLVEHFLRESREETGRAVRFDKDVVDALMRYPFPGNVRELRNIVQQLVALAPGEVVTGEALPERLLGERTLSLEKDPLRRFLRHPPQTNEELKTRRDEMRQLVEGYVHKLEAKFVRNVLERAGGNVTEAARLAGMNRTLFHRKLAAQDDGQTVD